MMKHKNLIDEQIEKTLNSLEGIRPAETDPYFLSRLKARMEKESTSNNPEGIWEFLLQPRMSLSIACFLIIVNIGLLIWSANKPAAQQKNRTALLEMVASDYALNASPYQELYDE